MVDPLIPAATLHEIAVMPMIIALTSTFTSLVDPFCVVGEGGIPIEDVDHQMRDGTQSCVVRRSPHQQLAALVCLRSGHVACEQVQHML